LEAPNLADTVKWHRITMDDDKDRSGMFLRECLRDEVGLAPGDVMLTNSVLCLPALTTSGKYQVTGALRRECAPWLKILIDTINPRVVATLGAKALHAVKLVEQHRLRLDPHVGQPQPWYGRVLVPLVHPSDLGRGYRQEEDQRADYRRLREVLSAQIATPSTPTQA
jgi:uracil-DNA glycosylase family 4